MQSETLEKMKKPELLELCKDALADAKANDEYARTVEEKLEGLDAAYQQRLNQANEIINDLRDSRTAALHALDAYRVLHPIPSVPFNYERKVGEPIPEELIPTEFAQILGHVDSILRRDRPVSGSW